MLLKFKCLHLMAALMLSACTMGAMETSEIQSVSANCGNVDQKISMLEQEKADNDRRGAAGIGQIMPVSAVARLVRGSYETNSSIATGEWGRMIDAKIIELQNFKRQCAMTGGFN